MVGRALLIAVLSFLFIGLLPASSEAQRRIAVIDEEPLPGDGPGDMVLAVRRDTRYIISLLFDSGEAATHRMGEDGQLTLVGRTPAGPEPRAAALAHGGELAVIANSIANELGIFEVGDDGILREINRVPSGGLNPYDVDVAYNDIVVVSNRDSHRINTYHIDRRGRLIPLDDAVTGREPHVVTVSSRGFVPVRNRAYRAAGLSERDHRDDPTPSGALVAVANQGDRTVSLYTVDRRGKLTPADTMPLDNLRPQTLSWQGRNLYVALDAPFPQDDIIRRFRVRRNGQIVQHEDTPAGAFLTDIEAAGDRVFAVTVNRNNPADFFDDRDEVRVYRRERTGLVLDAAVQTPGVPPSFKQISTHRIGGGARHVTVTEYQGDWLRWLIYLPDEP